VIFEEREDAKEKPRVKSLGFCLSGKTRVLLTAILLEVLGTWKLS